MNKRKLHYAIFDAISALLAIGIIWAFGWMVMDMLSKI